VVRFCGSRCTLHYTDVVWCCNHNDAITNSPSPCNDSNYCVIHAIVLITRSVSYQFSTFTDRLLSLIQINVQRKRRRRFRTESKVFYIRGSSRLRTMSQRELNSSPISVLVLINLDVDTLPPSQTTVWNQWKVKTIDVGHSIECITNAGHSIAFNMFCPLWPLTFWPNINWWARTRDGLSPGQVWLLHFQPFWF